MSTLLDLLTRYPNCKVTIRAGGTPRKKPYEGQLRVLARKGRLIRVRRKVHERGQFIGYQVRNGRPLWDWVSEGSLTPLERGTYMHKRAERGDAV